MKLEGVKGRARQSGMQVGELEGKVEKRDTIV